MSSFRFTAELQSYSVDLMLLRKVEHYLFTTASKTLDISTEALRKNYSVKLTDGFGTESFQSIELYEHSIFPDDISEVQLILRIPGKDYLNFVLIFNEEWKKCRISIEMTKDESRQAVVLFWNGLERILGFNKTKHHLFYGKGYLPTLALFTAVACFLAFCNYYPTSPRRALVLGTIFVFITIWYAIGPNIHPYISFDSQKNKNKKEWSNWFKYSLVGLVIFDGVLVFLIKRILNIS